MNIQDKQHAEQVLEKLFLGSQFDGVKFGLDDKTTFIYFTHYRNKTPDHLWINIESTWNIYPDTADCYENRGETLTLTEYEQYKLLYSIRRERIKGIYLGDDSRHLYVELESGRTLFINGFHDEYECWQAGDGSWFTGNNWLIVATPENGISISSLEEYNL